MDQSPAGGGDVRVVGDYMLGRHVGQGAFSVVWHARHRVCGTDVAVKEIFMERLSKKHQQNVRSEITILRHIRHPNIIVLHDAIEAFGRIYLALEYCPGGDLSMYLQRHGRVPEATAKGFIRQLAAGLQVLRENNIIHRDLKPQVNLYTCPFFTMTLKNPILQDYLWIFVGLSYYSSPVQNLLLSTNGDNSVLKIADFGFARSLQPRLLTDTFCGTYLYMAPEILQHQKYDAKADLWSIGVILFQLVTGETPFTAINEGQLLQNIRKSNKLHFPPNINLSYGCIDLCQKLLRRNPVERLTFEEFFNHEFLLQSPFDVSLSQLSSIKGESSPLAECSLVKPSEDEAQEDYLPFLLEDESGGQDGSSSFTANKTSVGSIYRFSANKEVDKGAALSPSKNGDSHSRRVEMTGSRRSLCENFAGSTKETLPVNQKTCQFPSEVVDSLEFVDQDYVLVPGRPSELSSATVIVPRQPNSSCKLGTLSAVPPKINRPSAPVPIVGATVCHSHPIVSSGSHGSPKSGTSQGSMDVCDALEHPSAHFMTRIRSLQQCATVIADLVNEKIKDDNRLEAFSVQLVLLAVWKQSLHIRDAQAASAIDGSPSKEVGLRAMFKEDALNSQHYISSLCSPEPDAVCQQIEREFLLEVGRAENLARDLGQVDETTEMPDAIEIIFQYALTVGRHGAVFEMMDDMERAATNYSKAVQLLYFILAEAPLLALNPPFSLVKADQYRLHSYIDVLNNRQDQSLSVRMSLLKCEDQ